jgi:hypothetical protein
LACHGEGDEESGNEDALASLASLASFRVSFLGVFQTMEVAYGRLGVLEVHGVVIYVVDHHEVPRTPQERFQSTKNRKVILTARHCHACNDASLLKAHRPRSVVMIQEHA